MSSDTYRQAASILLLRNAAQRGREEFAYQLLLLHKPRKKDAWQLPQGGVEGSETIEQAALRELQEEASVSDVHLLGVSTETYQYDFPTSYRRFRPDAICGQRIGFVIGIAPENATVTVDAKEIDQYVWVYPDQVTQYIRRPVYVELVRKLVTEAKGLLKHKTSA